MKLRDSLAIFIDMNKSLFTDEILGRNFSSIDSHIINLKKPGFWGSLIEIFAIIKMLDINFNILIYDPFLDKKWVTTIERTNIIGLKITLILLNGYH